MKVDIESDLKLTYKHLMSRLSDRDYVETYVLSDTFANTFKTHLELNPKDVEGEYYTLTLFEIFAPKKNIRELYDHILSKINTTSPEVLFRFFIMHMKNKKPANWLEIFLSSYPAVLPELMGNDIYKNIDPKNHQDALLITYLLCEKYGIPTEKMFITREIVIEDHKVFAPFDASPEVICTITDIKTGVTTDCLAAKNKGTLTPITQIDQDFPLERHQQKILAITCNVHLHNKMKEKGCNARSREMALTQKMYSSTNEAFILEYANPNNICETLDIIIDIRTGHSISLKLLYEIEKLIKTDAEASKLITAQLVQMIKVAANDTMILDYREILKRQPLIYRMGILMMFLNKFQNQDYHYLVASICINYDNIVNKQKAGRFVSEYVTEFMDVLFTINNYD